MAEKQCKKCMSMIDAKASICPNCRSKQPSTVKNIVYIVLGLIIIGSFSKACTETPSTTSTVSAPAEVALTVKAKPIKAKHPDWKNEACNAVAEKEIYIGMTDDQVRAAWGKPYKINESKGSYGTHEQWVMYEHGSTYVYFENGKMTSLQQSK